MLDIFCSLVYTGDRTCIYISSVSILSFQKNFVENEGENASRS